MMVLSRTSVLLFLIFFFASCGKKHAEKSESSFSQKITSINAEDILEEGPVPALAKNFQINITFTNFNNEQKKKVLDAVDLIKQVVGSEEFRDRVLKKKFLYNEGLTSKEIYKLILLGQERLSDLGQNNTMELELTLYQDATSNTIGYTYPNIMTIWVNEKYLDQFTASDVADNLFHEWLHKLGFDHETFYTTTRRLTVPYAVGYLVKELAQNYETYH